MYRHSFLALSLALVLAGQPTSAAAQSNHVSYEATDPATGWRGVLELRFLPQSVVVGVLFQPNGGYRVFLGDIFRGGLRIPYVNLTEVSDPLGFLIELDPAEPREERLLRLAREGRFLDTSCQIVLQEFTCSNGQGTSSGRLRQLP